MARLPAMGRNAAAVAVLLISSVRKTISKAAPSTSTKRFVPCRKERPLPIHAASPEVSMGLGEAQAPTEQHEDVPRHALCGRPIEQEGPSRPVHRNREERDGTGDGDARVADVQADPIP